MGTDLARFAAVAAAAGAGIVVHVVLFRALDWKLGTATPPEGGDAETDEGISEEKDIEEKDTEDEPVRDEGGSEGSADLVRDSLARHCRRPAALALPALAAALVHPLVSTGDPLFAATGRFLTLLVVLGVGWLLIGLTGIAQDLFLVHFDTGVRDNLRARKVHTQVGIARKILIVAIGIVSLGAVLMSYERFREFGAGILASAGIAGIVLGLAAQKTLTNVIAGFQIALAQPIRIDDVVIVEGEWGRIEEITLTYVVVRIWDERRLVVPISHFIEKPFQNWTRTSAEILGTVFIRTDYSLPVEELRQEVGRLVEKNEHWDGRVWRLHVTEAGERTLELRALMSAADSPAAWELRCQVREELVEWVRTNHPGALPRFRAEVEGPGPGDKGSTSSRGPASPDRSPSA